VRQRAVCGQIAEAPEKVWVETVESGEMTPDLACRPLWLTTNQFLDKLHAHPQKAMR